MGIANYGKRATKIMDIDSIVDDQELKQLLILDTKNLIREMEEVEYELLFNKTESTFKAIDKLGINGTSLKSAAMWEVDGEIIYMNTTNNEKIALYRFSGERYVIKSKINTNKWKLSTETKKIGKYNCLKATTVKITDNTVVRVEKPVTAWYTTDLPVAHGPAGFGGLPGLIIELQVADVTFYFTKLKMVRTTKNKIKAPTGKITKLKEFNKICMEAAEEAFGPLD